MKSSLLFHNILPRAQSLLLLSLLALTSTVHASNDVHARVTAAASGSKHLRSRALAEGEASTQTGLYNTPPFSLQFDTLNRLSAAVDLTDAGDLIASTLQSPLKLTLEEFLLESFAIQSAQNDNLESLPEMLRTILSLDLEVTIWHEYSVHNKQDSRQRRDLQAGNSNIIQFYAEFVGTIQFVLVPNQDPASRDVIHSILSDWMDTTFRQDGQVLRNMFRDSPVPALQELQSLEILTDIENDKALGQNPFLGNSNGNNGNGNSSDSSAGAKALLAALVLCGTATLVAAALLVRPHVVARQRQLKLSSPDGAFPRPDDPTSTLPGRHDDAMDILEASERYLSQHRPDLFEAMSSNLKRGQGGNSNNSNNALASMDGIEGCVEDDLAEVDLTDTSSTGSASWWTKLTSTLRNHAIQHAQNRFVENLVCDEDPSEYPFAFSDFPRHDGTPCLIYSESEGGPATLRREGSVSKMNNVNNNMGLDNRRVSLSDEEFKMALSQHDTSHDESMVCSDDLVDLYDNSGESIEVEFTEKLERLVAMRHRHYEKESIMERGREIRRKERNKAEAYERQLRLRRHEMELDLDEIEASVNITTPTARNRKKAAWQETPEVNARKKAHRTIMSNPDLLSSANSTVFDEAIADNQHAKTTSTTTASSRYGPTTDAGCEQLSVSATPPIAPIDTAGMPPKAPKGPSPSSIVDNINNNGDYEQDDPDQPLKPARKHKHRLSHRRSFSHGTITGIQETEGGGGTDAAAAGGARHKRQGSNEEALMTFGIAAYTQFV
jgi:hypothetical protein